VGAAAGALWQFRPDLVRTWLPGLLPPPPEPAPSQAPPAASTPAPTTPSATAEASAQGDAEAPDAGATVEADAAPIPAESAKPPTAAVGEFNRKAAYAALGVAATKLGKCNEPGSASVSGEVIVTFIPSGRVSNVEVRGNLRDTPAAGCVVQAFRRVTVPPFSGDPEHLGRAVAVPERPAPAPPPTDEH